MPGPLGEANQLGHFGRGVMVCISPWNFPAAIFIGQICAALVAGNTVIANWCANALTDPKAWPGSVQILEVTPDKKVVWTFQDDATMKTVSSVQLLDVPGDPIKGEVIH